MKRITNVLLAGLIVILIFVSGCIGSGSATPSGGVDGLSITNMKAFGGTKGDTVSVQVDVENRGSVTATHSCLELYGYSWMVRTDKTGDSTAWYGLGTEDACTEPTGGGELRPRVGSQTADKDTIIADFDTTGIANPIRDQETFKPVAKVYSKYKTLALADVRAMSAVEYDRYLKSNKQTPINFVPTEGPIKITINGLNPVKVSGGKVPFEVVITNAGGANTEVFNPSKATGKAGYKTITKDDYDRVRLSALSLVDSNVGAGNVSCGNYAATTGRNIIRLNKDESTGQLKATLRCSFTTAGATDLRDTTFKVRVEVEYGYAVKYDTQLVLKKDTELDAGASGVQASSTPTGQFSRAILRSMSFVSNLV